MNSNSRILRFEPNVPCQIALKFSDGLNVESRYGKPQVRFTLEDGRLIYLNPEIAERIHRQEILPGEPFHICKRQNGSRVVWDLWLSPETEQARAKRETEAQAQDTQAHIADLTPILQRSIEKVQAIRTPPELRPTGTESPRPMPAAATMRPTRIPFDVALREVIQFTTQALKEAGEQWADGSKQDLVSTIIISACQSGLIGCWQREAA